MDKVLLMSNLIGTFHHWFHQRSERLNIICSNKSYTEEEIHNFLAFSWIRYLELNRIDYWTLASSSIKMLPRWFCVFLPVVVLMDWERHVKATEWVFPPKTVLSQDLVGFLQVHIYNTVDREESPLLNTVSAWGLRTENRLLHLGVLQM